MQMNMMTIWISSYFLCAPAVAHSHPATNRMNSFLISSVGHRYRHCRVSYPTSPRRRGNESESRSKSGGGDRDGGHPFRRFDYDGRVVTPTRSSCCCRRPAWEPRTMRRHCSRHLACCDCLRVPCRHQIARHCHLCPWRSASCYVHHHEMKKSPIQKRRRRIGSGSCRSSSCPSHGCRYSSSYDTGYPRKRKCKTKTKCTTIEN